MASRTVSPKLAYCLCMLILTVMCGVYYVEIIGKLPMGLHEWAQADRLALAYRYYDDGMNFFRPATFNLQPIDGVVGVEFPVQAYIAAALGHIFGRGSISTCYRVLDILIMCTGLMFLFHTVYKRTHDLVFSLMPVVFMACIPVYLYYSGNYMPDAASVSITLIAFSSLFNYFDNPDRPRHLYIALLWLTLATMLKTTAITYLAGTAAFCFFSRLKQYRTFRSVFPLILVSLGCIVLEAANLGMMQYLHRHYNSEIFTTTTHPFSSWEAFVSFIENNYKMYWMTEYMSLPQYTVYLIIVVTGGCLGFIYRGNRIGRLMLTFLAGAILFICLFGAQLNVHDYYILAIFYPLLAFALIPSVINLQPAFVASQPRLFKAFRIALVSTMAMLFFFTDHQLYQRHNGTGPYISTYYSYQWMQDGAGMLDKLSIPQSEHIVALNEDSPNLALIYFNRRGYNFGRRQWQEGSVSAANYMREKHITIAVCKEQTIRSVMNDSTFTRNFSILALENNKAILRLNP